MRYDAIMAESVTIVGHGNDEIEGYLARPLDSGPHPGVLVIHHMPGYDAATKEITRRFAMLGYAAVCPNLYSREAPGADPDDAAAAARAAGGVPDERFLGDAAGAARLLRRLSSANGKVGVIGFCSGGRHAVLAACGLELQAAVDCYGAFVVGEPPEGIPASVTPLYEWLPRLSCPVLGLFGAEDSYPSPEQVSELEGILTKHGKSFDFHSYPDAGHAFFAVDKPSYRPQAAVDGWRRVERFFAEHLAS